MRLIDADALKEAITQNREIDRNAVCDVLDIIYNAPTVLHDNYSMGYQDGVKTILSERPQGEWIPVGERLPEEMQKVLVWFEYYRYGNYNCMYQTYGFGYIYDGKWSSFINGETGWQDARIIAWMPLPEPPEAYKEAEE